MRKPVAILAAAILVCGLAAPAAAQRGRDSAQGDQANAREDMAAGRTMSAREIERRIIPQMRGSDYLGGSNIIDANVSYLRDKLEVNGQARLLQTVRGVGYTLRERP